MKRMFFRLRVLAIVHAVNVHADCQSSVLIDETLLFVDSPVTFSILRLAMVIAVDRMLVDKNPLDGVAYNRQVRHQSRVSQVMKSVAGSIYTLLC